MNALLSEPAPKVRRGLPGPAGAGVEALLAAATREVLVMTTGVGPADDPFGATRRVDLANLRRGVRYRVLAPDSARASGPLVAMAAAGADTRTAPVVPTSILVVDGNLALLPAERTGAAAFRLPGVVTTTIELFERMWSVAAPLVASALPEPTTLCRRERELLTLLSAGSTDETAAARLGVSVRTVRRMVADLMNRLGARSRFQAGAKAADRGWLLD